jgi:hypothetical protein
MRQRPMLDDAVIHLRYAPTCIGCIHRFGTMPMNLIRQVAERLSRGKVFRRRLPQRYGAVQFYVSPECGLRYLRGKLELVDPTSCP